MFDLQARQRFIPPTPKHSPPARRAVRRADPEAGNSDSARRGREDLKRQLRTEAGGLGARMKVKPEVFEWLSSAYGYTPPARELISPEPTDPTMREPWVDYEGMPAREESDAAILQSVPGRAFIRQKGDRDSADPTDVRQGSLGDCYVMAMLAAVAVVRPDIIKEMVTDHGDGTFTVRFPGILDESRSAVTVDSRFWVGVTGGRPTYAYGPMTAQQRELWPMIIEKAWADIHGGYSRIGRHRGDVSPTPSNADTALALTGLPPTIVPLSSLDAAGLRKILESHFQIGGQPVTFGSKSSDVEPKVVAWHAYSLLALQSDSADLYNPHGRKHLKGVKLQFILDNFESMVLLFVKGLEQPDYARPTDDSRVA